MASYLIHHTMDITQWTLQHSCPFTTDLHERENLHISF